MYRYQKRIYYKVVNDKKIYKSHRTLKEKW